MNKIIPLVQTKRPLRIQYLRECLSYDAETGNLCWISLPIRARKSLIGAVAGVIDRSGYRVVTFDGVRYLAHRLIWAHVHGSLPGQMIDHINRDKGDNRIQNLRLVDASQNAQNQPIHRPNKTGFAGVKKHHNRYVAVISFGKRVQKKLGSFATPEEAHECYMRHKRAMHPLAFQPGADGVSDANVMDAELGCRVAELEAEVLQQARINGMGAVGEHEALAERIREAHDLSLDGEHRECRTALLRIANALGIAPTEAKPAQDAVDDLQGAVNWLSTAIDRCDVGDIQQRLSIGYNRARRLLDAALSAKKGG